MFKLVKNELYKLFHKKSTIITLFILMMFVVLTNLFYKNMDMSFSVYYADMEYINNLKKEINSFDLINGNMSEYASLHASLADQEYVNGKQNDWQVSKYYSIVSSKVSDYYYNLYVYNDKEAADKLQQEINDLKSRLDNNDWEYFVNLDIESLEYNISMAEGNSNMIGSIELEAMKYQKYLLDYRLKNKVSYDNSYLNTALNNLESDITGKINYERAQTDKIRENYKEAYASFYENEYIINNKVDTKNVQSLREIIISFFSEYVFLILIFIIMIAGSIVSDEFNKGTIKLLLTLPYRRSQILMAKLLTILLMIPFVTIFILFIEILIGGIILGFDSLSIPVVAYNFKINAIETMSVWKYFCLNFAGILPMLFLLATLAFALSTLICSNAFAITITFCGYIGSGIINNFVLYYNVEFLKYFVTPNWDLRSFIFGGVSEYSIPMAQSIVTCAIYFLIMVVVAFVVFKKKNIKNI